MQTIYLDISNKGVIPCIQAKQSEVGRKFLAVITDNGVPYKVNKNSLLSVWYEGDTDAGNYSSIDDVSAFSVDGNKITVELVAQMLLKPGNGELCLSITHSDGGETNTWNIPYCVEHKPGAGSSVPTEYYTALTEAGSEAAKYATQAKKTAESLSSLFIESDKYPGCYYRIVKDVTEWINPPMIVGEEYRTTERHNGNPVYCQAVEFGVFPNTAEKNFNHGIKDVNFMLEWHAINISTGTNVENSQQVEWTRVTRTTIDVKTKADASSWNVRFSLKYTKTK